MKNTISSYECQSTCAKHPAELNNELCRARWLRYLQRLVSSSRAELEVETGFDDVDVRRDADVSKRNSTAHRWCTDQCVGVVVTEVVVVVFDEASEQVQEGIFTSATDRPATVGIAGCRDAKSADLGIEVTLLPGAAA